MANEVGTVNDSDFPAEVAAYMGSGALPLYAGIGDAGREFMRDNMAAAALGGNPDAEGYWLVVRVEPDGSGALVQIPPHGANS